MFHLQAATRKPRPQHKVKCIVPRGEERIACLLGSAEGCGGPQKLQKAVRAILSPVFQTSRVPAFQRSYPGYSRVPGLRPSLNDYPNTQLPVLLVWMIAHNNCRRSFDAQ